MAVNLIHKGGMKEQTMSDEHLQEMIEKVIREGDQLQKQTEFWKLVLEGSYDGICIVDGKENLVWMNSAYEKIAGLKREDVTGKNLKELVDNKEISQAAFADMVAYDWPGNVRELRNVLERAYIMSNEAKIITDDLGISRNYSARRLLGKKEIQEPMDLKMLLAKIELEYLDAAYQAKRNVREAARLVKMDPTTFARRRKFLSERFKPNQN